MFASLSFPSTGCRRWGPGEAMSTSLGRALSRLSKENMIVVTNFSTTVLINHVDEKLTIACEVAPLVPLRHLFASYIHDRHSTISIWTPRTISLRGDGRMVLVTLSQLTKKSFPPDGSHSDFHRYALLNNRRAFKQFLGGRLQCKQDPNPFLRDGRPTGNLSWIHPIEPLPEDALAFLRAVVCYTLPGYLIAHKRSVSC